jgi:hypothetical protein
VTATFNDVPVLCCRDTAVTEGVRLKVGGPTTVSVKVVVLVSVAEVPVTIIGYCPVAAAEEAAMDSVVVVAELAGWKVPVTPDGKPLALKLTAPVNAFCGLTATFTVVPEPWVADTAGAEGVRLKVGGPITVSVKVVVWVRVPEVPITVIGYCPGAVAGCT